MIGAVGTLILIGGNVLGSMLVPNHDWVADTVSDLAAGRYEIIQDVALYAYASALVALAIGAAHVHLDGDRWNASIASLCILALLVVVIGARNEYGDGDNEGVVIHIYLVYGLGVFFTLLFFCAAKGMGEVSRSYRRLSIVCGVLWVLGAPIFFLLPTGFDGAWERGLGLITAAWALGFAHLLWSLARRI